MTNQEFRLAIRKLVNDKLDDWFALEPDDRFEPAAIRTIDNVPHAAATACDWIADELEDSLT